MTFGLNTQNPLISNGRFLTPDNYWVEINDNNDIPNILKDIGINVNNHISYVIDRGYGDIIGRTNYWLWLNELCPVSIEFQSCEHHTEVFRYNVESTIDKVECLMDQYGYTDYTFKIIDDKRFRELKEKKHEANKGNYFFINLYNKLQDWYPFTKTWTGLFSDYVIYYKYDYADWEAVLLNWSSNQDKVMGISDEEKYNAKCDEIVSNLEKKHTVKIMDYTWPASRWFDEMRKAKFVVTNRGAGLYISAPMMMPICLTVMEKHLEKFRYFHNFTKKIVFSVDPEWIGNLDNDHKDFVNMPKHKYIKEGFNGIFR